MGHLRNGVLSVVEPPTPQISTHPINVRSRCYHFSPRPLAGCGAFTVQDPSFGQNLGTSADTQNVPQLGVRPLNIIDNRRVIVCISTTRTARNHCTERQLQHETQQMARYHTKHIQLWILVDRVGGLKIRGGHTGTGIGTRRHRLSGLSDDGDRYVWDLSLDLVQDLQRSVRVL